MQEVYFLIRQAKIPRPIPPNKSSAPTMPNIGDCVGVPLSVGV